MEIGETILWEDRMVGARIKDDRLAVQYEMRAPCF
jgi:hypothetical protein